MKPIETEEEYYSALARVIELMNAQVDTPEGAELDQLVSIIERYEDEMFSIEENI